GWCRPDAGSRRSPLILAGLTRFFGNGKRLPNLGAVLDSKGHDTSSERAACVLGIRRAAFLPRSNGNEHRALIGQWSAGQTRRLMRFRRFLPKQSSGFRFNGIKPSDGITEQKRVFVADWNSQHGRPYRSSRLKHPANASRSGVESLYQTAGTTDEHVPTDNR